jgi:hypothetical protein
MQFGKQKQNNFMELLKEKKGVEKSWLMLCVQILLSSGNNTS